MWVHFFWTSFEMYPISIVWTCHKGWSHYAMNLAAGSCLKMSACTNSTHYPHHANFFHFTYMIEWKHIRGVKICFPLYYFSSYPCLNFNHFIIKKYFYNIFHIMIGQNIKKGISTLESSKIVVMEYNFFTKFEFKANLIMILWTLVKFEKFRTWHNFTFQCVLL